MTTQRSSTDFYEMHLLKVTVVAARNTMLHPMAFSVRNEKKVIERIRGAEPSIVRTRNEDGSMQKRTKDSAINLLSYFTALTFLAVFSHSHKTFTVRLKSTTLERGPTKSSQNGSIRKLNNTIVL